MAGLVFAVTFYSANGADYISGNLLRTIAWINSIDKISLSPIIGYHGFLPGQFEYMSVNTIIDYGIAESHYLQLAVDFGVLPAIISLYVTYLISAQCIRKYYSRPSFSVLLTPALFSGVIFVDRFYGSLFGGMFLTFIFCAICISFDESAKEEPVKQMSLLGYKK
jgi:hypothetical protein